MLSTLGSFDVASRSSTASTTSSCGSVSPARIGRRKRWSRPRYRIARRTCAACCDGPPIESGVVIFEARRSSTSRCIRSGSANPGRSCGQSRNTQLTWEKISMGCGAQFGGRPRVEIGIRCTPGEVERIVIAGSSAIFTRDDQGVVRVRNPLSCLRNAPCIRTETPPLGTCRWDGSVKVTSQPSRFRCRRNLGLGLRYRSHGSNDVSSPVGDTSCTPSGVHRARTRSCGQGSNASRSPSSVSRYSKGYRAAMATGVTASEACLAW